MFETDIKQSPTASDGTASFGTAEISKSDNSDLSIVSVEDLAKYVSADQLESLGLEVLKQSLIALGMKCGGTLQDRAQRLFLAKDTPLSELDKSVFAKRKKTNKNS